MYNDDMMYNMPFRGVMPCCPFMQPAYGMPNMMRSEDIDLEADIPIDDKLEDSVDEDLRDDIEQNIQDETVENIEDNREESKDPSEEIREEIKCDENQFRSPNDVDRIFRRIQRNNPMLIRRLLMYGVPYPVAVRTIRRIIYLTLEYED